MNSSNIITWSNNSNLVKMDGGNSVYVSCIQGWDGKDVNTVTGSIMYWMDQPIPALLPGGKDVPAGCK